MKFLLFFVQQQDGHVLQVEVVARDDQNLVQDPLQIGRGEHRLAGVVENGDFLHGWPDFTGPGLVTEGSESNQPRESSLVAGVCRLVGIGFLHSPGHGFDNPQNDQTEAEIHSHTQIKTAGHMAGRHWKVGHHKEIDEVTHNDRRQGVGEVLHYLF